MAPLSTAAWGRAIVVAAAALTGAAAATASSAPRASEKPLPLRASVTFRQPPDAVRATALGVIDPVRRPGLRARAGHRLVAVRVALKNVGGRILYSGAANCTAFGSVGLTDAGGGRHAARRGLSPDLASFFALRANPYVEARALVRGQTVTGYYTFELRGKVRPALFSLAPCRRVPPARWRLR